MRHTTVRDSDYCSRHAGASGQVRIILVWYTTMRATTVRQVLLFPPRGRLRAGSYYSGLVYHNAGNNSPSGSFYKTSNKRDSANASVTRGRGAAAVQASHFVTSINNR